MPRTLLLLIWILFAYSLATPMSVVEFTTFLRQQFAHEFKLDYADIELEVLQPEKLPLDRYTVNNIQVLWSISPQRPGLHKIWLTYKPAHSRSERRACFVRIALWQEVLVASRDLNVNEIISEKNTGFKRLLITDPKATYFTDWSQVKDKMSKQRIKEGSMLTSHTVKYIPDVAIGSPVKVKINYGNIVIETVGKVNEEARVGEKVTVICDFMRRNLPGILVSPDLVQVQIR